MATRATGNRSAPVRNAEIAGLLRRYAGTLRVQGGDRFKIKAYGRAAETIELLGAPVTELLARGGRLEDLPGIGKAIGAVIRQIVDTGRFLALDTALATLPPELAELSGRPALDPKVTLRAYKKLGVSGVNELRERLESGELERALGSRAAFQIRVGLDERPRALLWKAEPISRTIAGHLASFPGVTHVDPVGSLRRKTDTVGDLGFLLTGPDAAQALESFSSFGGVQSAEQIKNGAWRFRLTSGLSVNLSACKPADRGLALLRATGSAAHLKDLKAHAATQNLAFSPRGLKARRVDCADEAAIYEALGLQFIPPELREGRGEVEAASQGTLPSLVRLEDLKGDLHTHTTSSDGAHSIAEMAAAARARGYRYIGITDHSRSLKIAGGLTETQLRRQLEVIDALNAHLEDFVVLKSAEVDILEDGSLDYPDALLAELDYTVCSIHSHFRLNKAKQTARILRAMDNPHFNILGHTTGRLLLKRAGYEVDIDQLVEHARATGCLFEINSSPNRLDLSDEHARIARDAGIKIAVNTDAHSTTELGFITAGLNQARRAWLQPADVLNTLPLLRLRKELRRRQASGP